jgi:methyl-accepting chemotaxis protein
MQNGEVKTKKFQSLAISLAVTFFFLSLVILLIARAFDVYFSFQVQQQFIVNQQQLIAKEAANTVTGFAAEKFSVLKTAIKLGDLASGYKEEQTLVIEKLLGAEPAFREIIIFNPQGEELSRVSRLSSDMNHIFNPGEIAAILSAIEKEKSYISPIFIDDLNNEPLVTMAVPALDVFGDFKGILLAEVNLKFMWDLVGGIKVGKNGQAYVVDKTGNLIAFGDISRVLAREDVSHLQEVKRFIQSTSGAKTPDTTSLNISKGILGTDVVSTHVSLGIPDWAVVIELPVFEAYDSMIQVMVRSLGILVFSLVLTVLAGLFLSKRITNPIINLRDAALSISKGKLDTTIDIKSRDEIGQLAQAFNQMTVDLASSRHALEEYSKNLEGQVAQRTEELNAKLSELERMNKLMVGREIRMVDLKKEIQVLQEKLTQAMQSST